MKITLKKLKIHTSLSEETTAFTSDICVDGHVVGYAKNTGQGGDTEYHCYHETREQLELMNKAEKYALSLPSIKYKFGESEIEIKSSLEQIIDSLVDDEFNKKEKIKQQNKMLKLFPNHIVYGIPNGDTYSIMSFQKKPYFSEMIKSSNGLEALTNTYNKIKNELKDGEIIFNNNLDFLK